MNTHQMEATADALVKPGRGILAADKSFPTIEKRFRTIGVSSTEENRRAYREMLFTAPGLGVKLPMALSTGALRIRTQPKKG